MTDPPQSVLYVTYDGLLEPLGGSQVLPYVEGLARRGFRMSILSFEKGADLMDEDRRQGMKRRLAAAGIQWLPLRYHRRPSVAATAYDVARGIRAALRMRTGDEGGIVHARSYVAGLIGLEVARRRGMRLLFDMRGFWIDERIEIGMWKAGSPLVRILRRLERRLLREAHGVVVLTRKAVELLPKLAPEASLPRVEVIPTCVDLGRFQPGEDPQASRRELGLGEGPILIYTGSLGTWYLGERTLLMGREFTRRSGGQYVVLTRETELAESLASKVGADAMIRSVPHEEMPRWLAACDAGLAFVRPDPAKRASSPTKIGEYLASGLAVAATRGVGDLDDHFEDSAVAFTCDPEDPVEAVAKRLLEAAAQPDRVAAARELAVRHYSLERGIQLYEGIYRDLGLEA